MKKFENHELQYMVQDMCNYDGRLEDLYIYDMNDFNEIMYGQSPLWIATRIFFGKFDPTDEFFKYNGYGNLESLNFYEYGDELQKYRKEIVSNYIEMVEDGKIEDVNNLLEIESEEEESKNEI
ncbi:hypothetical protein F6J35_04440 [Staphylococcus pseudintermedius]|uniref:hypothetical protein n=1 Tax=Staphylococcus pseudintermedius TaxID=283734 RepID=UPI0011239BD3|nr:hypothetical protein [Staphylococcus pseudintermedius]EGQ1746964.1 hypothetical protein [Staphylococcus pseudintermedius]EGQ2843550.1 hypothetical protein [Staphylococcus pseudintermedius]EGQ3034897.1 hypothetical protein [Staphylococcus pseudintermedius]EGQ3388970.1 hypothetical protein [Staphylococcus pseudintermedius]EGQ3425136.1 hypothetical protein [Staphylococcus pseudintermedius]